MPNRKYLLIVFLFFELLVLSPLQAYCNMDMLPGIFSLVGIGIILLSFNISSTITKLPIITIIACTLPLVAYIIYRSPMIFELIPIDYKIADMLPVMERMTERRISGDDVYAVIPELWGGTNPIYLPAMWLPLVMAKIMEVDIRWIPVVGMLLLLPIIVFIKNWQPKMVTLIGILLPLILFLVWHFRFHLNIMTMSNEGTVFFYYAFLCLALVRKNPLLIGIAMVLCLLSRYIIAPWCIMISIAFWIYKDRSFNIKFMVSALITGVVLMTIGSAWNNIGDFIGLSNHYLEALITKQDKYEPLVQESLSLARYFSFEAIPAIHWAMTILSILTPFLCLFYFVRKSIDEQFELFAIASLKLSLIVFFALLTMPYHYLYYISFIVSLCLVSFVLNKDSTSGTNIKST